MQSNLNSGDVAWLLTASGLVLLMTPGLALFYGGMVRKRNLVATMFQSFISMAMMSLLWVLVGFSLAFGDSVHGLIGNPFTFLGFSGVGLEPRPEFAATIPFALFALFQMKFAIITPALITGAFAERVRFKTYLLFSALFHLLVYCPVAHWVWHPNGILRKMGVLDFAGGAVVHVTAGLAALISVLVMRQRSQRDHTPTNIPFVLLGTGLLWFGWFGFNAGSALAANGQAVQAFLTTSTAGAAGMLTWMFLDWWQRGKPSAMGASIGAIVSLVAITPAAGFVSVASSFAIGVITPVISFCAVKWRSRTNLDDTLDVFPCHGVGGLVGMILTAVFAQENGLITGKVDLLVAHFIALGIVTAFTCVMTYLILVALRFFTTLEVSPEEEIYGLDVVEHNETVGTSFESAQVGVVQSFRYVPAAPTLGH